MKADTVVMIFDVLMMIVFSALWTLMLLGAFADEIVLNKIELTFLLYLIFYVQRIYYLNKKDSEKRQ